MKTVIFASTNKDKLKEIGEILSDRDIELKTMSEIGFDDEIEENGKDFTDNALIKARAVEDYVLANKPEMKEYIIIADDSGLEIDHMGGMPGVQSHRWLGERTYTQAMLDVIEEMKDVPDEERGARFVCAMAACVNGHEPMIVKEKVEGMVDRELKGSEGFGYDPFFYVPEYGCTTAQMTRQQKNEISHRGKAMRAMRDLLVKENIL
jgi:XTP/dITP diphosphohydrolase